MQRVLFCLPVLGCIAPLERKKKKKNSRNADSEGADDAIALSKRMPNELVLE